MSEVHPLFALKNSGESVNDLNFWSKSPKNDNFKDLFLLAAYGGNAGIDLWNLSTRRPVHHIHCETTQGILSVAPANDSDIVSLSKEGCLQVHQISESVKCKVKIQIGDVGFCKASVDRQHENKGCMVAVPGNTTSSVCIWDMNQQAVVSRLLVPGSIKLGMVMCLKLSFENKILVAGYEDGSIICWDTTKHTMLFHAERLFSEPVMGLDVIMEHNRIQGVATSAKEEVIKWESCGNDRNIIMSDDCNNAFSSMTFSVLKTLPLINAGVSCVSIRNDKKIFATGGWDNNVRLFSWKSTKPLAVLDYHNDSIRSLTFASAHSSSNQILACGSSDKKISVWKVYND